MELKVQQKWLTLCWMILFLVIVVFLFYGKHVVKGEDRKYQNDQQILQYVQQQLSKNEKLSPQVSSLLTALYQKYPGDYKLMWYMGILNVQNNNFNKAAINYQTALNTRPALLTGSLFALQYGEIEYYLKRYDHATKLLNIALNDQDSKQYKKQITKLLNGIQQVAKK